MPALALLFAYAARRRQEALAAFAAADQLPAAQATARLRRWRAALVVSGVALLAIALAGPRYGTQVQEVRQEGLDLLIALDVSNSMRAEDVAPSRLERAQYELDYLLSRLAGSRVGIVLFAGEAFLQTPLTTDLGTVRRFLAAAEPDLIPAQGTDLGAALRVASGAFDDGGATSDTERRARVVLVVSDGEDHPERYTSALRTAEDAGLLIFAAGVGEPDGVPIPIYRQGQLTGYHTDRAGQIVTSRLNDGTLRRIARSGDYIHIGRSGGSLRDFPDRLATLDRSTLASDQMARFSERFQWPLGLALALLALEPLVAARRRRHRVAA